MAEIKGFMMYFDKIGATDHLTREENGELFEAIIAYTRDDIIVDFDSRVVEAVFYTIKPTLDDDKERYENTCQKRAESGKKGGRPKKEEEESEEKAKGFSEKAKKANGFYENQMVFEKSKKSQNKNKNKNENKNNSGDTDVSLSTPVDESLESESFFDEKSDKPTARQIVDMFNSICVSYPKVTALSEKRKKAIYARIRSGYSADAFRVLFEKAEMSDFLKGRNNSDWRATFDWLIKDGNMAKVLDGNYDNRPASGYVCGNGQAVPKAFVGMAEWAAKNDETTNPLGILSG